MARCMGAVCALLIGAAALAGGAAQAQEFKGKSAGDILVRARALAVVPQEKGDIFNAVGDTGLDVKVSNDYIPELDFSYFFTDNIAAELIAGTSRHSVKTQTGIDAGNVALLPPTLTVQYHFNPKGRISPYVGAGINYTIFYNEDGDAVAPIDYENSFGWALQAGVDVALSGPWSLNFDVKKLWLDTDVKMAGGALRSDVDLNPWLIGIGVGYRF